MTIDGNSGPIKDKIIFFDNLAPKDTHKTKKEGIESAVNQKITGSKKLPVVHKPKIPYYPSSVNSHNYTMSSDLQSSIIDTLSSNDSDDDQDFSDNKVKDTPPSYKRASPSKKKRTSPQFLADRKSSSNQNNVNPQTSTFSRASPSKSRRLKEVQSSRVRHDSEMEMLAEALVKTAVVSEDMAPLIDTLSRSKEGPAILKHIAANNPPSFLHRMILVGLQVGDDKGVDLLCQAAGIPNNGKEALLSELTLGYLKDGGHEVAKEMYEEIAPNAEVTSFVQEILSGNDIPMAELVKLIEDPSTRLGAMKAIDEIINTGSDRSSTLVAAFAQHRDTLASLVKDMVSMRGAVELNIDKYKADGFKGIAFFRGTTAAMRLLTALDKEIFPTATTKSFIHELSVSDSSYELDPYKGANEAERKSIEQQLQQECSSLLNHLEHEVVPNLPSGLKDTYKSFSEFLQREGMSQKDAVWFATNMFILRSINPKVSTAQNPDFMKISPSQRRHVVLFSKVLQQVANNQVVESKEEFMVPVVKPLLVDPDIQQCIANIGLHLTS